MGHFRKTQLSILLNTDCNLLCTYCYVGTDNRRPDIEDISKSNPRIIDLKFVKRAILDFFAKYDSRQIRFFSVGEATVVFSRMKEIKEWVDSEIPEKCTFELQTNGYFSFEKAKWIADNINIVWVSCDGPPSVQNYYRPALHGKNSASVVEKNIRFLTQQGITVGCRSTIRCP